MSASPVIIFFLSLLISSTLSHAADSDDLHKLLQSGQYEAAYARALSRRSLMEGDPEFDFAYGQAALRSGHPLEAAFAFERVITLEPHNAVARMALGDAYASLGNQQEARRWYRSLFSDPDLGQQAADALAKMDTPFARLSRKLRLWVDFSSGFDSNVNQGSGHDGLRINPSMGAPFFFRFPDSFRSQSARFHESRLGAVFVHETSAGRAVDAHLSVGKKQNLGEDQFDQGRHAFNTGYRINSGPGAFRVAARYLQDDLNDKRLRYTWGMTGEYRAMDQQSWIYGWQQSLLLAVSRMAYPKQSQRNADQYLLGISAERQIEQVQHRLRFYFGDEQVNGEASYLGRRFASIGWHAEFLGMPRYAEGIRSNLKPVIGSLTPLILGSTPFIELRYTHSKNRGELPALRQRRRDRIAELKAGARTRIGRKWELRLEFETRDANSNIEIYDHQRKLIRLGLRYDFP